MKTCLVVDDSRVVRKVARHILEEMQFTIAEAENGQDALGMCRKRMPDAVLLDWSMPVMDGIDFIGALRKEAGGTKPKVIVCATEHDPDYVARATAAGANGYVMKPFDREALHDTFQKVGLV